MSIADKGFGGLIVDGAATRVVVTDPELTADAVDVVRGVFDDQVLVDSELGRLNRTFGRTVPVSPLLLDGLEKAFFAAELTSGTVDFAPGFDWRALEIGGTDVRLADWMQLDLTATATGIAVDLAARSVVAELGCGVLVASADHVATAGPEPVAGWQVTVDGCARVAIPSGCGVVTATSDAAVKSVTVAAPSAYLAATLARGALHPGADARSWLAELGMPARIVGRRGTPLTTAGWPAAA